MYVLKGDACIARPQTWTALSTRDCKLSLADIVPDSGHDYVRFARAGKFEFEFGAQVLIVDTIGMHTLKI